MTLLSDPPLSDPKPTRARHARRAHPSSSLLRVVVAAVIRLEEVDGAAGHAARRQIDQALRDAVERVGEDGPVAAVPAVRVACAHLAAGDLEDAYLALLTARDLLR
ncbi:hypothetical protein [Actinomycetospora atypica]|uniref:Uncharacterized protein n=1 Tax=Actinomycetospora atypica TaxID=1290095 RepID=A0ABV9YH92_9PSEU